MKRCAVVLLSGLLLAATQSRGTSLEWYGIGSNDPGTGRVVVAWFADDHVPPTLPTVRVHLPDAACRTSSVVWSVSDPTRIELVGTDSADAVAAYPVYTLFVQPGKQLGGAAITAKLGSPCNLTLRIPTYTYKSMSVACGAGVSVSFDGYGELRRSSLDQSDIYETGPGPGAVPSPVDACDAEFTSDISTLHVPFGGRLIPKSDRSFSSISVRDWRNDVTRVVGRRDVNDSSALIFKTRNGSFVKVLSTDGSGARGAYIMAPAGGEFADVTSARL